jgi:hypothetical protein
VFWQALTGLVSTLIIQPNLGTLAQIVDLVPPETLANQGHPVLAKQDIDHVWDHQ